MKLYSHYLAANTTFLSTFIISSSEGSSKGAPSASLPIWDLLQIYGGIRQGLSVHLEHLSSISVVQWSGQHQSQFKEEYTQPLPDYTDKQNEVWLY